MESLTRTIRLHRAQRAFRRSSALYRGFVGGRGAGKSWVGAYDLIRRARRGRTYLVGSPTGVLMGDTTFPTFKKIALDLGVWGSARLTPYPNVELTTGATVRFRTADDPEKMRGPNLSGVWLDEASLMHRDAYGICIAALREEGEQGWLSATFTPKGRLHWTYPTFAEGRPNTELFRAATRANPFLPPGFHATLAEQYDDQSARQELDGLFVDVEGAEWPSTYFDGPGFWVRDEDWPALDQFAVRTAFLDPSKGADAKLSDWQALVLHGRTADGTEYVEADLARRPITAPRAPDGTPMGDGMVESALARAKAFRVHGLGVESNQFQVLLKVPLEIEAKRLGYDMPLYLVDNRDPKPLRIRRLGPALAQRKMRFRDNRGTRLLVEQLRAFPDPGAHDDGPDAAEGARRLSISLFNGEA